MNQPAAFAWSTRLFLAALVGLPLVVTPWVSGIYDNVFLAPKFLWLQAAVLPAALLVVLACRRSLRFDLATGLLLAFAAWLTCSAVVHGWSRSVMGAFNRQDGLFAHLVYVLCAAAAFAWHARQGPGAQAQLAKTFTLLGVASGLIVVGQAAGWWGVVGGIDRGGAVNATISGGTLGHRGYMGGLLALILPLAAAVAWRERSWRWPLALALVTFALGLTATRGAWLAGIAGYGAWVVLQDAWRAWRVHAMVGLGVLACFVPGLDTERQITAGNVTEDNGRLVLYGTALFGIAERPLLGWGVNGVIPAMHARPVEDVVRELNPSVSEVVSSRVLSSPVSEGYAVMISTPRERDVLVTQPVNKVHNEYLDYAVSHGLPAAVLFVALLSSAIWKARRSSPLYAAALIGYAAYLLTWPEIIRFAPLAWAVLGSALVTFNPNEVKA